MCTPVAVQRWLLRPPVIDFLVKLLNIQSPTGFAEPAVAFVENELSQFSQLQLIRTRKGALVAKWEVESDLPPIALTAHVDTLGAVVKEIKSNGRLKLSRIGGVEWPTVETEGVWIFTSKGEKIRGSVLIDTRAEGVQRGRAGLGRAEHEEVGKCHESALRLPLLRSPTPILDHLS